MYCHNCGAQIPEWAGFCGKCGSKVIKLEPPVQPAGNIPEQQGGVSEPPKPPVEQNGVSQPVNPPAEQGFNIPENPAPTPPPPPYTPGEFQLTAPSNDYRLFEPAAPNFYTPQPQPQYQYTPQAQVTVESLKEIYAAQDRWEEQIKNNEIASPWQPSNSFMPPPANGTPYGQQVQNVPVPPVYGSQPVPPAYPQIQGQPQTPYYHPLNSPGANNTGEKKYLLYLGWISFAIGFFIIAIASAAGIGFGWAYTKYDERKGKAVIWANAILLVLTIVFAIIRSATGMQV